MHDRGQWRSFVSCSSRYKSISSVVNYCYIDLDVGFTDVCTHYYLYGFILFHFFLFSLVVAIVRQNGIRIKYGWMRIYSAGNVHVLLLRCAVYRHKVVFTHRTRLSCDEANNSILSVSCIRSIPVIRVMQHLPVMCSFPAVSNKTPGLCQYSCTNSIYFFLYDTHHLWPKQ